MKAAVYYQNDKVFVEEAEKPPIAGGELLVKVKACGICVGDTMEWYQKPKAPIVLGHEVTGVVEEIGAGVSGFSVGDRVAAHHHVPCMHCEYCNNGDYTLCRTFKSSNYRPGGFCEYIALSSLHVKMDTLVLPDHISFAEGTLIEPLACVIHAVRKMAVKPDDRVVLVGAGTIGIMFIQVLQAYGVKDILVYETIAWRAEKARELTGVTVKPPLEDPLENAQEYFEQKGLKGADQVFVVAKDLRAMELGIEMVNPGGKVLLFATPANDEYLKFYVSKAFFKETTIKLSYSADHLDTREALRLISTHSILVKELITHTYLLSQVSEGIIQTASRGNALKCVVIVDDKE